MGLHAPRPHMLDTVIVLSITSVSVLNTIDNYLPFAGMNKIYGVNYGH